MSSRIPSILSAITFSLTINFVYSAIDMENHCPCQFCPNATGLHSAKSHQSRRIYHVASSTQAFSFRTLMQQNAPQHSTRTKSIMQASESRTVKRSGSPFSVKTAVSGMKSLLPLKLVSTTTTITEACPPPSPINRSTFGFESSFQPRKKSPRSRKLSRAGRYFPHLPLVIRPEQYRDIPVYTDAGLPVPGQSYYPQFDLWRKFSPSISSSDGDWLEECSSPNTANTEASFGDYQDCIHVNISKGPHAVHCLDQSPTGGQATSCRTSDMSFKCLGENATADDTAHIQTSFEKMQVSDQICLPQILAQSMPSEYAVRGWLGETICENIAEEDESAVSSLPATPNRNSVVQDESLPRSPLSIPPRSSSFMNTRPVVPPNGCDFQQPALSDIEAEYTVDCPSDYTHTFEENYHNSRNAIFDRGESEGAFPPPILQSRAAKFRIGTPPMESPLEWPNRPPVTEALLPSPSDSALSIIEDLVRYFPFNAFIDYRSHISAVRTQLHLISPENNKFIPNPSTSPQETGSPTRRKSRTRRLTVSLSSLTRTGQDTKPPSSPFPSLLDLPRQTISSHIDLDPLQRLFPLATPSMIQALYAYILGYILIVEIHSILSAKSADPDRRAMSLSKAADMLGVPLIKDRPPTVNDRIENFVFSKRAKGVTTSLQNSIYCLVRGMAPDAIPGNGPKDFAEHLVMRALIELITGCEERSARFT